MRTILHVDMDAFFASVAQRDHPELRGKPVLVGGDGNRGVVSTASYEARVYGCRSAQPMAVAKRLCPHAIVVQADGPRLREINGQIHDIFGRFTPLIQPVSIDEAFLDCTGVERLFGDGSTIGAEIRRLIEKRTGVTASVGVSFNKFLAKLASDLNKPNGMTVITPENIETILPPLKVGKIMGVGPKMVTKLERMGVRTIADLRKQTPDWCGQVFGSWGERVRNLSFGQDERGVTPDRQAKSIGHEQTFGVDLTIQDEVRAVLLGQAEQVGLRLRRAGLFAGGVTVKIRFGQFQTITRAATLENPTDNTKALYDAGVGLFNDWSRASFSPVRLIGLSCNRFCESRQLGLFDFVQSEKQQQVDQALDRVRAKFGKYSIGRGSR